MPEATVAGGNGGAGRRELWQAQAGSSFIPITEELQEVQKELDDVHVEGDGCLGSNKW